MAIDHLINRAISLIGEADIVRARALAGRALAEAPKNAAALNTMGLVETADHRHAEAAHYYQQATTADPRDAAYRVNLGYSKVLSGDFDAARNEFDRALAIDPANASAYQNIIWITKMMPGDPLIDQIRALASRAIPGSEDFIKLNYALGKCLDDTGEYDDAFEAYRQANECQPSHFDARQHEEFFDAVHGFWTTERLRKLRPFGSTSRKPVFIIGMPRSGSTLVEEKLSADPRIAGLGEVPDIIRMSGVMQRHHPKNAIYPQWCADIPNDAFGGLAKLYLEKYEARFPEAERLINKSLLNFAYAGMIAAMFPESTIVETRRDAIDTCLSCYFKDLKVAHQYSVRLNTLGRFYRYYAQNMRHWRETLQNLVSVQYESFIQDADSGTAALKSAMGLDTQANQASGGRYRFVQTFSAWQVRQPIYTHAVRRWRNYEKHLVPLIDALGDLADTETS